MSIDLYLIVPYSPSMTKEKNIKIIKANHWSGTHFKVILNGVKYPKARGEYYQPFGDSEHDKKKLAIEWGIAESEGKYLSCGGVLYNSEKEYLKKQGRETVKHFDKQEFL